MSQFRCLTKRQLQGLMRKLLPGRCLLCRQPSGSDALCKPCLHGLPPVIPACPSCALPQGTTGMACGACQEDPPPWRGAWAPLRYEFPVDGLVRALKYRGDLAAGAALASAMALGPRPGGYGEHQPWLIPVPLHWTRELRRGFNQAMELALALSRVTGWPVHTELVRTRRTVPQAGLDAPARRSNLRGAFAWRGKPLAGQRVVLIDDVLTTGATARACARALGAADAVDLWMAARALGPASSDARDTRLSQRAGPSARGPASAR